MLKLSNVRAIKSTVLGLALIAVGVYVLIEGITQDYWIVGGFVIGGLLLFFTGDKFIKKLEKLVFGRVLFEKPEDKPSE